MRKKQINKLFYIVSNVFKGCYVNIIGMISVTELIVLLRTSHLLGWTKKFYSPELKKITILYTLLLIVQIIAELAVGNTFTNALKGIMITMMSYFVFVFYLELLVKDINIIKWGPLASAASLLIFGDQFGYAETGEATFFKFYFAPIIIQITLFLLLSGKKSIQKNITFIAGGLSIFIIAGGARSLGFSLLFSTFMYYLFRKYKSISLKKMLPGVIIAIIVFQIFYAWIYVPKVSNGEWGSKQNRDQLAKIDNSKNVFMMLYVARTDFFVSWKAFMDKPLWGHGAWTLDSNLKYTKMLAHFQEDDTYGKETTMDFLIPVHSVVIGMGTQHGLIKFILFFVLFLYMFSLGIKALNKGIPKEYEFYLIYMWISSLQHIIFGPPAVLKTTGSIAFAIFLAFYLLNNEEKIQINHRNSNVQIS